MSALLEQIAADRIEFADGRHSPTRAMQVACQRGVRLAAKNPDIDPVALHVGRKVAAGQKLSDEHVEHMASYHAAWDSPPVGETNTTAVEHMLWAGAPGARWSAARTAAMDVSALSDTEAPDLLNLAAEGKSPIFEVFVRDHLGEEHEVDDQNNLIWSPILRSGMLATRPGPGGTKLHEPLVFIPGHSSDPNKEIGLQDLHDAFHKKAFEHVTIPTSHENDLLDNTGFIVDTKIVESKRRPGQMVLMGAHKFTEPDVMEKVKRGTIANRSCSIVYDHTNTETGEHFPVAIEHVALTNKPWVRGMAPYGSEDFNDEHEVVPMLLSEAPRTDLATDPTGNSWDGSESRFSDQQWAKACILDRGTGTAKERYSEPIREPDGTLNLNAVHAAASRLNQVKGASLAQKRSAARALIGAYRKIGEQPPATVTKLVTTATNLSEAERKEILLADVQWGANELSMNSMTDQVVAALSNYGHPDEFYPLYRVQDIVAGSDPKALVRVDYGDPQGVDDAWVVPLEVDGDKVSLADYSQWTSVQQEWVTDEDADQDKREVADLIGDTQLSEAPSPMPNGSNTGGAMPPTVKEVIERLGLSDDQHAALAPILEQNQKLATELAEERKERRKEAVTTRVKALQKSGFMPGFCKVYEEIALGDDGETAATLNLSDENGNKSGEKTYTVTDVADRLIAAIPMKDGNVALSESANLLTSPVSGRPPADEADADKLSGDSEKSAAEKADDFLKFAEQASPGITAQNGMALSTDQPKER